MRLVSVGVALALFLVALPSIAFAAEAGDRGTVAVGVVAGLVGLFWLGQVVDREQPRRPAGRRGKSGGW